MNIHREDANDIRRAVEQFVPIGVRAVELTRALDQWAASYPSTADWVPSVAMTYAAAWPKMKTEELLIICQTTMWVFSFDKMIDTDTVMTPEAMKATVDHYREIGYGTSAHPR